MDRTPGSCAQNAGGVVVRKREAGSVSGANPVRGSDHPGRAHRGRKGHAGHRQALPVERGCRGHPISGRRSRAGKSRHHGVKGSPPGGDKLEFASMTKRRALRMLLLLLAVDAGARGVLSIFASKWALTHSFPSVAQSEMTALLLLIIREAGALDIGVSVMLFRAFRHPEGNAGVIEGIAFALGVVAVVSVISV